MAISCNQPIRIFRALSRISCVAFLHFQSLPSETPSLRTPQRSQTMRTGPPQPRARRKAPKRLSSAVVSSQLPRPPFPRSRTSPHGFASVLKQDMWLCVCVCRRVCSLGESNTNPSACCWWHVLRFPPISTALQWLCFSDLFQFGQDASSNWLETCSSFCGPSVLVEKGRWEKSPVAALPNPPGNKKKQKTSNYANIMWDKVEEILGFRLDCSKRFGHQLVACWVHYYVLSIFWRVGALTQHSGE